MRESNHHRSTPSLLNVLACLLPAVLAGCAGSPSLLAPASPEAEQIAGLFWGVFAVATVIFVIVAGLLLYAVGRFRERPGAPHPDQVHGNLRLEIAWTLAPGLILIGIFAATVQTMTGVTQEQANSLKIKVAGDQWFWRFDYPDLKITTASELHVPVGQPVEVEVGSNDVIHSFWAPELFGKPDAIPGRSNWVRFTASRAGIFRGQCAEFCGVQHANMGFFVVAEPREQFEGWVKTMQAVATAPPSGRTEEGAEDFQKAGCSACHTIAGTAAQGRIGPNLTRFGSRRSIAALTVDNTPENLAAWLGNPQAVKPGTKMPHLKLSAETIREIVVYLESLK